ncbi:hypothetical protein E1176_05010, partial [Fulvivirga sp. RKSG066]|uniref:MutS-related protein n=1 Tax=Fulvivirga aurantia TaxID=2529383 RepID=UPI0012BC85C3
MSDRENIFTARAAQFKIEADALNKQSNVYSTTRIVLFIIAIVLIVYFANIRYGLGIGIVALLFPVIFGSVVNRHNRVTKKLLRCRNLTKINEEEILRLKGDLKSFDSGNEFLIEKHAYAKDIDVFGRNSLYQLLNRANTPSGKQTLANWLNAKSTREEIAGRQKAVVELKEQLDWRQEFQSAGMTDNSNVETFESVIKWINEPNKIQHNQTTKWLAYMLPLGMLTLIAFNIFTDLSIYFTVGLAVINGAILKRYADYVSDITESTDKGIQTLKAYGDLISIIEKSSFKTQYLKEQKHVFSHDSFSASRSILELQRILEFLHGRGNMFYLFFNVILLFDIHLLRRAEKWKQQKHEDVSLWFDKIGCFEALNSLSGLAYAKTDFNMPDIVEKEYTLEAVDLGHPLISAKERINNDFSMQGQGSIALITGSNMSGKSTFLRTIGVNMTLAYAGAPVCAQKMSLSIMQLFTSMRTEDNLEEHISSFYAELQRIKQLLHLVEKGEPVLYMLDEILKGTNSEDRHAGAEALIRQLSHENAMGFVSTHDLALGKLSDELKNTTNYSFNSEIKDDKIVFKYRL